MAKTKIPSQAPKNLLSAKKELPKLIPTAIADRATRILLNKEDNTEPKLFLLFLEFLLIKVKSFSSSFRIVLSFATLIYRNIFYIFYRCRRGINRFCPLFESVYLPAFPAHHLAFGRGLPAFFAGCVP